MSINYHLLKKALSYLREITAEQCKKNYFSNYIPVHNDAVKALGQKRIAQEALPWGTLCG